MADEIHLDHIRKGTEAWNAWRSSWEAMYAYDHHGAPAPAPDLNDIQIPGVNLTRANLADAWMRRSDLRGTNFFQARLIGADLRETKLRLANLQQANLEGAWLHKADMPKANLIGTKLLVAALPEANLANARLMNADLTAADLSGATLTGANLTESDLTRANFTSANLTDANFTDANLAGANFAGANLTRANLTGADLTGTQLIEANLTECNLTRTSLTHTDFTRADLHDAQLVQAVLVNTSLVGANLTGCHVYGIASWDVDLTNATQIDLIITPEGQPTFAVDQLRLAQFIYLLLDNSEIRNVIDTITSKAVLILGRFTPDRKSILNALREELRRRNYLPMLFDFEKPANRDLTETIGTLAHLSRFIIVDLTDPRSAPHELMSFVRDLPSVPVQPLIFKDQQAYAMFENLERYPWVLPIFKYESKEKLIDSIQEMIIEPAEAKFTTLVPKT